MGAFAATSMPASCSGECSGRASVAPGDGMGNVTPLPSSPDAEDSDLDLKPVVVARVRPISEAEALHGAEPVVHVTPETGLVEIAAKNGGNETQGKVLAVQCTHALNDSASNEDAYLKFRHMVDALFDRCNVTIFAFGETGSGKTYTMEYITNRLLSDIWSQKRFYDSFNVQISMVEIENEKIYDLSAKARTSLHILNYQVKGANWMEFSTEEQIRKDLGACWKRRKTAATKLNSSSSRSHAVCTVRTSVSKAGINFTSDAHIIDLAGSERSGLAAFDGNPNASLTLLSMIVKDITRGRERNNFRQTKLTHLLQPALTGRCILGLVFTLNPCSVRGATSSVQFASNMMRLPSARPQRNRVVMTEAQLAAASRDLMDKEAEVKRKLVAAEERRAVAEEENERLRRELASALRQRETEVKGNVNSLEAELKAFQGQVARDRELVKVMTCHFEGYATRMAKTLEDLLETERQEGGDASSEEAEVEKTLASVREALGLLAEAEELYSAGSLLEAGQRLQTAAEGLALLQPETLLEGLVKRLREAVVEKRLGQRSAAYVDTLQAQLGSSQKDALPQTDPSSASLSLSSSLSALGKRTLVHADNDAYVHSLEMQIRLLRKEITTLRSNAAPSLPSIEEPGSVGGENRDNGALQRAKTNWQGLLQTMGYCLPSETTAVSFSRRSSDSAQEELDEDMAREIARIPEAGAYERLSHVVGLSKLCCRRFIQLEGVTKMIVKGLKGRHPTSAEACRTAAHVNVFCKLHAARDQMRLHGGCDLLMDMLAVEGGSEADDARINACMAIQELSVGNPANKKLFSDLAMRSLVQLMSSESQHVQEAASAALSAVLEGSQVAHGAARVAGSLEALLSLLLIRNNRVKLQAVYALGRIAANDPETQAYIKEVTLLSEVGGRQEPINGLACIAGGLKDEDQTIRQAHGQTLLACVYGNLESLQALKNPEMLRVVGLEPQEVTMRLIRALAALLVQDAGLVQNNFMTGDSSVVASAAESNFPHYGVLLSGNWEQREPSLWAGDHPSLASFHRNPQFLVQVPNAMQVSVHLQLQPGQGTGHHGLQVLCFPVDPSCQGRSDVVFARGLSGLAEHGKESCTLTADLEEGAYTFIIVHNGRCSQRKLAFKVSFVAEAEFEAEAVTTLQGWHSQAPTCAKGCLRGWWRGGADVTGGDFWRNPHFLVTEGRPTSEPGNLLASEASTSDYSVSPRSINGGCMMVSVHLKKTPGNSLDISSSAEPGLAVFRHRSKHPDNDLQLRLVGGLEMSDSCSQTQALTVLHKSPERLVAAVPSPESDSAAVLVPFLAGCRSSEIEVDFEINIFSLGPIAVSGIDHKCREWKWLSTFSIPWQSGNPGQQLSAAAGLRLYQEQRLAVRCVCPGTQEQRRDPGVLTITGHEHTDWMVSAQGAIGGLCVHATAEAIKDGTYTVEAKLQPQDPAAEMPPLLLQVFSECQLDLFSRGEAEPLDIMVKDISLQLPRPLQIDGTSKEETEPTGDKMLNSMRNSQSKEAARHLRDVVNELKQEVAAIKDSRLAKRRQVSISSTSDLSTRRRLSDGEQLGFNVRSSLVAKSMEGLLEEIRNKRNGKVNPTVHSSTNSSHLSQVLGRSAPASMWAAKPASHSCTMTGPLVNVKHSSGIAAVLCSPPQDKAVQIESTPGGDPRQQDSLLLRREVAFHDVVPPPLPSSSTSGSESSHQDAVAMQERDDALQKLEETKAKNEELERRVLELEAIVAARSPH